MKIEIDVSERSLEEQIEAAIGDVADEQYVRVYSVRQAIRDFAAGKFARAPMPEIVRLPWSVDQAVIPESNPRSYFVSVCGPYGAHFTGPRKPTKREAILAFNELFGGAS